MAAFLLFFLLASAAGLRTSTDVDGAAFLDWGAEVEAAFAREEQSARPPASQLQLQEASQYTHTQLVGLSIFASYNSSRNEEGGDDIWYAGVKVMDGDHSSPEVRDTNNMADAKERVRLMRHFMEVAYASEHWSRSGEVLKIFMAPEFFFRGPYGAYNLASDHTGCSEEKAEGGALCSAAITYVLLELRKTVQEQRFADWLFVMGTITASSGSENRTEFYNFAPVMRGGPEGVGKHFVVPKGHMSGIDFLPCSGPHGQGCVEPPPMDVELYSLMSAGQVDRLEALGMRLSAPNHFHLEGIGFGIEICLDHEMSFLKKELKDVKVDVHLVTAAGMMINVRSSVARQGGAVYLQDGGPYGARTAYFCDGCDYLGKEEEEGYAPSSPRYNIFDDRFSVFKLYLEGGLGEKDRSEAYFGKGRSEFTTPRAEERKWSKKGFATEGLQTGEDLRFGKEVIARAFTTHDYMPTINIGPAFLLPLKGQP